MTDTYKPVKKVGQTYTPYYKGGTRVLIIYNIRNYLKAAMKGRTKRWDISKYGKVGQN